MGVEESPADMSDAQFGTDTDFRRTARVHMVLYLVLAIVGLSFFSAIRIGIDRGLPNSIGEESWGRVLFAVGAAITEMEHGGYGYTIARMMETVLTSAGLTGDPKILADLGMKFPENLHRPELINAAIDKAVHFKWPFNPNEAIRGSGSDDLGLVDYTRLKLPSVWLSDSVTLCSLLCHSCDFSFVLAVGISRATRLVAARGYRMRGTSPFVCIQSFRSE